MTTADDLATSSRAFRRFLVGDALALLAMAVGQVAVPWWITVRNGAHDLAVYVAASAIAGCVAIPVMSIAGDRYNKYALIQIGLSAYGMSGLFMALAAQMDIYDIRLLIVLESVAIVGLSLMSSVASVIAADILPTALAPKGLQRQRLSQSVGQLGGPLLGGGALAWGGVELALRLQVLLLILAIALFGSLPPPARSAARQKVRQSWLFDLTAGARAKWRIALERNWTLISFLVAVFLVPGIGMLLPLKVRSMGLSGQWLGMSEAALSLGIMLGAAATLSGTLVSRIGRYRLRLTASMLLGPMLVLVGYSANPIALAGALTLVGIMNSVVVMMGYSRRILATPQRFRTRMAAVNMMTPQFAAMIGPSAAGVLLLHTPIETVYLIFGAALLVCNFGYLFTPDFRTFMSLTDGELEGWYELRYPDAFQPEGAHTISEV